jgi:hypothetical protein
MRLGPAFPIVVYEEVVSDPIGANTDITNFDIVTMEATAQGDHATDIDVFMYEGGRFVDDSSGGVTSPQTVTGVNEAYQSDVWKKSGAGSVLLNGVDQWVDVEDTDDFPDASGAFTVEFWGKFASLPAAWRNAINVGPALGDRWYFAVNSSGLVQFNWNPSGGTGVVVDSVGTYNDTNEHHFAITFDGVDDWNMWVDGVLEKNQTQAVTTRNFAGPITIGSDQGAGGSAPWPGYIDMFRVSNVERYTAPFTPPTSLIDDANTMLLCNFDNVGWT